MKNIPLAIQGVYPRYGIHTSFFYSVVLVIESELVKCGSSSFWHAPEGPKISIPKEDIMSCITGGL